MLFQFHEGPIKTSLPAPDTGYFGSFNSMKVRLKHILSQHLGPQIEFQFHEGPIKTLVASVDNYYNTVSIP